jgi:hypothetical protein
LQFDASASLNLTSVTSDVTGTNTARTRIPMRTDPSGTPSRLLYMRTPSSSLTCTTVYGRSSANPGQ